MVHERKYFQILTTGDAGVGITQIYDNHPLSLKVGQEMLEKPARVILETKSTRPASKVHELACFPLR